MKDKLSYILYLMFILVVIFPEASIAQGEISDFNTVFYDNYSFGAGLKSNGIKLVYRKGYYLDIHRRSVWEFALTTIKDPREIKFANPFYLSTQNIYFGKTNSCVEIRAGKGGMLILSDKLDIGSVQIRTVMSAGGSLAFIKPVYYTVLDKTGTYTYDTKFSQDVILQQIVEMAPFYKGLDELKINPGVYTKLGISFEYSKTKLFIQALELGGTFSAYLLPIELVYQAPERHFFLNLYIDYRIGYYYPSKGKRSKRLNK